MNNKRKYKNVDFLIHSECQVTRVFFHVESCNVQRKAGLITRVCVAYCSRYATDELVEAVRRATTVEEESVSTGYL